MKFNHKFLFILFAFIFILSLQACDTFKMKLRDKKGISEKCEILLKKDPQGLILYTDSLLKLSTKEKLEKPYLIEIYQFRQQAFASMSKMDAVLSTGETIRTLASDLADSLAMAKSLLFVKGDIDYTEQKKLSKYLPGAIHTFSKYKMPFEEAKLCATYGAILIQSGDYKRAQSYLLKAYDMMERMDSVKNLINISMNIGSNYQQLKSNDLAWEYYKRALNFAKGQNDSLAQVSVLMNMGDYYSQMANKSDSVMLYYQQAKTYLPKGSPYYLAMKLDYNIALEALNQKQYKQSEDKFKVMLNNCLQNNLMEGYAYAWRGLAEVYAAIGNTQQAINAIKQSFLVFDSLGLKYDAMSQADRLTSLYNTVGNYKEEVAAMKISKKLNDSLLSVEKQVAVHELAEKYQSEKKELENRSLKNRLWNIKMYVLIFIIASMVFFVLWRQRIKLVHERAISYEILMVKYRAEKEIAEKQTDSANIPVQKVMDDAAASKEQLLHTQLINYFQSEKPYLNPKLRLEEVALLLNTTVKELNKVLKEHNIPSFYAFLNQYRVEETRRLFEDPVNQQLKLAAIAEMAGFGAKQTFYSAFLQFTGVNPGYYRKNILNE